MHFKNLRAYLESASGVGTLMPQAERLMDLRRIYAEVVPRQLLRSSSIVNYRQEKVVIFAENNAVAARIKLLSPRLINDFVKRGLQVTGIRLEVQPRPETRAAAQTARRRLSIAGARNLDSLAERLPDSPLKQAVTSLSRRATAEDDQDPLPPGERDPES